MSVPTISDTGGVFLSWTRADTDRTGPLGQLVDALRAAGVPVWIDDGQIGPFDAIPAAVRDGLGQAKVLLAWYSNAYPTRRACREELTLALLAAEDTGQGEGRVLVVNPEPTLDHVLETPLLQRRFATADDVCDPLTLARRIAQRVDAATDCFGSLSAPTRVRWYGGLGWEGGSRRFVGRLTELWKLHDLLHRTTGLAGPEQPGRAVAVVSGFGGVGKSLLAAEYAHLFADCYAGGVVWLTALGHDTASRTVAPDQAAAAADAAFAVVANGLDLNVAGRDPATVREMVKTALDQRGEKTLWVIDDLPSGLTEAQLGAWRCPARCVVELITTRDRSHSRFGQIELDVLDPADAVELLAHCRTLSADERHEAELFAAEVGYHPLACDVAGLYVSSRTTFAAYRQLSAGSVQEFDALAAELADQLPGDHAREITTTVATSLAGVGGDGWRMLRVAALLPPIPIPRHLIAAVFARLADPEADTPDPAQVERELERAVGDSHQDGLWRYDSDTDSINIHVVVRQAAAALDPEPDQLTPTRKATIAALTDVLGTDVYDPRRYPDIALDAEHARHLVVTTEHLDIGTAVLADKVADYDFGAGRATDSEFRLLAYDACCRMLGDDHPYALSIAVSLGATLERVEGAAAARDFQQATYDTCRRVLGDDDRATLSSASQLADTLTELAMVGGVSAGTSDSTRKTQLAAAQNLHQATYVTCRRVLGDDDLDTLASAAGLAVTLACLGDLAAARNLHQATYDARRRVLGDDHPDTLASEDGLANTLNAMGDVAAARDLHRAIYATLRRLLGDDHPVTLTCAYNLAIDLSDLGDHAAARDLHQAVFDIRRRVLGDDHPYTLQSGNLLANELAYVGDVAVARDLHQAVYDARRGVLGDDDADTLQSARNLAALESLLDSRGRSKRRFWGRR